MPRDVDDDDAPLPRRKRRRDRDDDDDAGVVGTVIPYKNPQALAGYYCGIGALVPFLGAVLAPVAIILGVLGLVAVNKRPRIRGTVHAIIGIVGGLFGCYNYVLVALFFLGRLQR